MAISALMPLVLRGEPLTPVEVRGFLRAVVQTQRAALDVDPDPHGLSMEGVNAARGASQDVQDAIFADLNPFDAWAKHFELISAADEADDAETQISKRLLRSFLLPAQNAAGHQTALQIAFERAATESVWRFRIIPQLSIIPKISTSGDGGNISASVRRAARLVKAGLPPLFRDTWWSVSADGIKWDHRSFSGATKTPYGASLFNVDLPDDARSLLPHLSGGGVIDLTYRTLIWAHDLRWLASGAFPTRTRPVTGQRADTSEDTLWMMMAAWKALSACAFEWEQIDRNSPARDGRKKGQELGAERISKINQENSDRAQRWRSLAIERAISMRAKQPDRTLASIAEAIAGELTLELSLDRALVPATVYSYLRKTEPALVLTRRTG